MRIYFPSRIGMMITLSPTYRRFDDSQKKMVYSLATNTLAGQTLNEEQLASLITREINQKGTQFVAKTIRMFACHAVRH